MALRPYSFITLRLRSVYNMILIRFMTDHRKYDCEGSSLSMDNLNPGVLKMRYDITGATVYRARELVRELKKGVQKPFKKVIFANVGDAHAVGVQPITYLRHMCAACTYPELLTHSTFPDDVKEKALEILASCDGGSIGSYTDELGIPVIREKIAAYIKKRDGFDADPDHIILTAGATSGARNILKLINCPINGKRPACLIPVPQYPLYSAALEETSIEDVNYYLNETKCWGLDQEELERAISTCKGHPRAIVVVNPGNPTGTVLSHEDIVETIKFANRYKLMIVADEVYQQNIWSTVQRFHSFKKVLMEMGPEYSKVELASLMSASKGAAAECGLRGGYIELVNFCKPVVKQFIKLMNVVPCAPSVGQIAICCIVDPPQPGDPSFETYNHEKNHILNRMKTNAALAQETFNLIPGLHCEPIEGAMYAFPQLHLPIAAIAAAKSEELEPDEFYCLELLEETGICVVPGCSFRQMPGTYHFRTTVLPGRKKFKTMLQSLTDFHIQFLEKYGGKTEVEDD